MGYFISLSKSATETRLKAAELTILFSGLALVLGAIGEYLEDQDKLPKWTKPIFILMVVGSLIGEFVGDAGVYLFSEQLQTINDREIVGLKKLAMPRSLDQNAAAIALSPFHDVTAQVYTIPDFEARHTAALIEATLELAQWRSHWTVFNSVTNANFRWSGVWIAVGEKDPNDPRSSKLSEAARRLAEVLNMNGIDCRPPESRKLGSSLAVFVGLRPVPGESFTNFRLPKEDATVMGP